jgi:hypothetical protein
VLVVAASLSGDRLGDLWTAVSDATTVQPVLDALTRGGISTTPDFLLASFGADSGATPFALSVIVRGALGARVSAVSEQFDVSGEGVSTWVERTTPDVATIEIGTRPTHSGKGVSSEFVLKFGSAPIAWLVLGTQVESESLPAPAPAVPVAAAAPTAPPPPQKPAEVEVAVETIVDPGVTITDPTISAPPSAEDSETGYDFLFGETMKRTVEGAAVRDAPTEASGDHDGKTAVGLSAAERRAARLARRGRDAVTTTETRASFVLEFSTGERESLDQGLIIGRAPSASKVSASSVPRLVTVGGPDQDISRNHVQVAVEGGTVMVTDLHSRNGTMIVLPGRPPQQLRGGQPTAVLVGAVVDLGAGVTFTVGEV